MSTDQDGAPRRPIIELSNKEAKTFFLKHESYSPLSCHPISDLKVCSVKSLKCLERTFI